VRKPDEDIDRAAILARRRRFILMALGGLGCHPPSGSTSPGEVESVVHGEQAPARAPLHASTKPEPPPISDEQLRAALDDPEMDFCVSNPVAIAAPMLNDDQRAEVSKAMVARAERAQAEGDLSCAIALLEEVYYRIPGHHIWAFRIGELAAAAGECQKASEYLRHFVKYGDTEEHAEALARAQQLLETPELKSCEPPPYTYSEVAPQVCLDIALPRDPEPPPPPPETKRERRQRERAERRAEREQERASEIFRARKRR
jgi:hypothetical protein